MTPRPKIVPELYCADLARSLRFYVGTLGFTVRYERPAERFTYLDLGGAELMLEEPQDPSRTFLAAVPDYPFGRGVHLQIEVEDAGALYGQVHAAGCPVPLPLEDRWYQTSDHEEAGNRQFMVMDPDGYLLRFWHDLGTRRLGDRPALER